MSYKQKRQITEAGNAAAHIPLGDARGHDLAWLNDVLLFPRESVAHPSLLELARHCCGLVILDHRKLPESAMSVLTRAERQRAKFMGLKRRQSFLGVRLGLKLLARYLCPELARVPSLGLHTLDAETARPILPAFAGSDVYRVSASHDPELTVVAASTNVFGIDAESRSAQAWRGRRFFMHPWEIEMAQDFFLGPEEAALRIWSSKEAVAKAFSVGLGQTAQDASLSAISEKTSHITYQNNKWDVKHFKITNSLISLLRTS